MGERVKCKQCRSIFDKDEATRKAGVLFCKNWPESCGGGEFDLAAVDDNDHAWFDHKEAHPLRISRASKRCLMDHPVDEVVVGEVV